MHLLRCYYFPRYVRNGSHYVKEPTHIVRYVFTFGACPPLVCEYAAATPRYLVGCVCRLLPYSVIGLPPQCRSVYCLLTLQRYGLFVSRKTFYGLFFSILQKSLLQLFLEGVTHPECFRSYKRRTLYLFTRGYILRMRDVCARLPGCVLLHCTRTPPGNALHIVRCDVSPSVHVRRTPNRRTHIYRGRDPRTDAILLSTARGFTFEKGSLEEQQCLIFRNLKVYFWKRLFIKMSRPFWQPRKA